MNGGSGRISGSCRDFDDGRLIPHRSRSDSIGHIDLSHTLHDQIPALQSPVVVLGGRSSEHPTCAPQVDRSLMGTCVRGGQTSNLQNMGGRR